jgi:hypothetical protein
VNQRAGAEPFFSEPLPDAPWPVAARNLLSDRENSLYQRLLSLYPDHKIFVQVALSQMIDVPESRRLRREIHRTYGSSPHKKKYWLALLEMYGEKEKKLPIKGDGPSVKAGIPLMSLDTASTLSRRVSRG